MARNSRTSQTARTTIRTLQQRLGKFSAKRKWDTFHTPKNLSMALVVECGELAEHFQWLSAAQSKRLNKKTLIEVEQEIADVFLYLLRLADILKIDLLEAASKKILINDQKYPADVVRGSAKKYTEY